MIDSQTWRFRVLSVPLFAVLLTGLGGCSTTPPREAAQPLSTSDHGYALLFQLMGDEKDVSKLLIIKRERPELRELIKRISETTGAAYKQLETYGRNDRLNLKDNGLPYAETQTRERISKAKAHELLTEKGRDFELRLLLTQNEALTYGAHFAAFTADHEADPQRASFLRGLAGNLSRLRDDVLAMLTKNYSWPG